MEKKAVQMSLDETSQEILDLSMSFDEKVSIAESPVSQELVAKLVAQIVNLEREVRQIKSEMKAQRSSGKQQRPGNEAPIKHQIYF